MRVKNRMIIEQGTIAAIEDDCLWVATVRRSSCAGCRAEAGCGQSLLAKVNDHNPLLRVLFNGHHGSAFQIGDSVEIAVPDALVAAGSLVAYLLPLFFLLLFTGVAHHFFAQDGVTALAALLGLLSGGLILRRFAWLSRNNPRLQPVLVNAPSSSIIQARSCS